MGAIRENWPLPPRPERPGPVLVFSTYASPEPQPPACVEAAVALAHSGREVWLVTSSAALDKIDPARALRTTPNLRLLVWELPECQLAPRRNALGRWLHRRLWYHSVDRSIQSCQLLMGVSVIHRHADAGAAPDEPLALDELDAIARPRADASAARAAAAPASTTAEPVCALTRPRDAAEADSRAVAQHPHPPASADRVAAASDLQRRS